MPPPSLVCCARNFGYGPAAKLLHIAAKLAGHDLRLIFLGTGVSYELATRANLFDEAVHALPHTEQAQQVISESDAMLNLMDQAYAAMARDSGKRVYAIDSLAWMRDRFTREDKGAHRYWIQRFVDDDQSLAMVGNNAQLVGPIIGGRIERSGPRSDTVVVNLGGYESPLSSAAKDPSYLKFILSGLHVLPPGSQILAGKKCVEYAQENVSDPNLVIKSVSHETALDSMANASLVFTSPGLTAAYECFHAGVPTYFLPPQNYSQWWILKHLRDHDLAPHSFHWEDLMPGRGVLPRMAVSDRTPLVYGAVRDLGRSPAARDCLVRGIDAAMRADHEDLVRRQRDFLASLGPGGTDFIAGELARGLLAPATAAHAPSGGTL